jgi:transcriptional regulator NrdR family protein
MRCPKCNSKESKVIHTNKYANFVERIRECKKCKAIYKTEEWMTGTYKMRQLREIKEV